MKKLLLLGLLSMPSFAAVGVFTNDFSQNQGVDFVGGLLFPYMKMATGADGTLLPVSNSNPIPVSSTPGGQTAVTFVRNDYSSVNVTTGAWVQLVASLGSPINRIQIFDSSGQTLKIGIGAAASEVAKIIVFPGGNGDVIWAIPVSSRVSIEAISGTANSGEIDVNFFQ